jgi:hypothetical protein
MKVGYAMKIPQILKSLWRKARESAGDVFFKMNPDSYTESDPY